MSSRVAPNLSQNLFGDVTRHDHSHLDLDHLLLRLTSAPHGNFKQQIAYIDACAVRFSTLSFHASAGKFQPGMGDPRLDVEQSAFFSVSPGELSYNGRFSQEVLRVLQTAGERKGPWPPDPDEVFTSVQPLMTGHQHPVFLKYRYLSGSEE